MSLNSFSPTKTYGAGLSLPESKVDSFIDSLDTWISTNLEGKAPDKTASTTITGAWTFEGPVTTVNRIVPKRVANATSNYFAINAAVIFGQTSTASAVTFTIPEANATNVGKIVIVKDESGGAATHNISIFVDGGHNIDGSISSTISTNYGVKRFISDGNNWFSW